MAQPDTDPFDELRSRIRSTADAAERLTFEAAMGGAPREDDADGSRRAADDATREAQALLALVAMLRDVLPEDLRRQLTDLIRQVLLLVRAVLDHLLRRLEAPGDRPAPTAPVVEDIPLD